MIEGIIIAQGADKCAPLLTEKVLPYMTERMRARYDGLNFIPTHALIATFSYPYSDDDNGVALYKRGEDYVEFNKHILENAVKVLQALYTENNFYASGNAYPLPAVHAARLSGLGFIGAHGMLITEEHGSFITIGAILTDLPVREGTDGGYCSRCGACITACPVNALTLTETERHFDKEKCLAFITGKKEKTPEDITLLEKHKRVVGCDYCQLACKWNARKCGMLINQ